MVDQKFAPDFIAKGDLVILRHWQVSDGKHFSRWWTQGEWQQFDAPWETCDEDNQRDQEWFLRQLKRGESSWLNNRAVIATPNNILIGWVNLYGRENNPHARFVGIDICEDTHLNRGLGTEALRLWADHLFTTIDLHKICLDTWSFNPRMISTAEKIGFVCKSHQYKARHWQGEWLDRLHFEISHEKWSVHAPK